MWKTVLDRYGVQNLQENGWSTLSSDPNPTSQREGPGKSSLSEVWKSDAGQISERKNEQEETLLQLLKISNLQRLQAQTQFLIARKATYSDRISSDHT
jgi:hypothetical protein